MSLQSTPCKLGNTWCLYTDQSWDCAGGDWQIITANGELVAWMTFWDREVYRFGDITGVEHYAWDDPEVEEFKASLKLTPADMLNIWCELRVDFAGCCRAKSTLVPWESLFGPRETTCPVTDEVFCPRNDEI